MEFEPVPKTAQYKQNLLNHEKILKLKTTQNLKKNSTSFVNPSFGKRLLYRDEQNIILDFTQPLSPDGLNLQKLTSESPREKSSRSNEYQDKCLQSPSNKKIAAQI